MKKNILLLCILLIGISGLAQKKDLTLEDAVLRQYSSFYPSGITGIQWIKNSNTICWLSDDYQSLLSTSPKSSTIDTLLKVSELNSMTGLELKSVKNPVWLDSNNFYFSNQNQYYKVDMLNRKSSKWLDVPSGDNREFNLKSEAFAFTIDNNLYLKEKNKEAKAITNFEDGNIVAGQAIARHEFGISKGIFWSPDGQSIAFYQKDESAVSNYPILDITTTPGSLVEVKYPMAGQGSEFASIGVYDLENQTTTYLEVTGPVDQYLTNLGWGPDSRYIYIAVLNRGQNHMQLQQFDANNGKFIKTLFEEKHDKYVEPEQAVRFIPGSNKEFLWFSERSGYNHLYKYNVKGELLNQVTSGNWEAQEIIGFDDDVEEVFILGADKTGLNRYLFGANLSNKKSKLLTKTPGIHRYSPSTDCEYFIDQYSSMDIPGSTELINDDGKTIRTLHTASNPLADYNMATAELIVLKAEDGTLLHARMIKPSNFDPNKKYPVLTYVYGGPHAQMIANRWLLSAPLWMYYFAEQGNLVFTLDNRGSGNRGFDFENVIHRQLGEPEIRDQLVGVEYLKSLDYVDANKMAIHGWSYGGYMTTSLMLKTPGVYQVGVAGGPVTDWKYYEIMYGERYMDTPEENPEGYEMTSLLNKADKLEGKLLLIHGTSDDVVVMQHNLSLVQKFVEAGKQVDFFPYPMHKHNVRGKDRLHLIQKILNYIDDNLN
jgi:dipeptidyl-peptidase-4